MALIGIFSMTFSGCNNEVPFQKDAKREFNKEKLNKLKEDKSFNYDREIKKSESWFGQTFGRFFRFLANFLDGVIGIIVVVVIFALLLFVIVRTAKGGFYRNRKLERPTPIIEDAENIIEVDLEQLLKEALKKSNYRLAIRYWYLIILKNLHGKNQIKWEKEKTNYDYINEIKKEDVKGQLKHLTLIFEYAWYGETAIDKEGFDVLQNDFNTFNKNIR